MKSVPTVAVSGCGAVAREYYAPVLAQRVRSRGLRVVALHDPEPSGLRVLARRFPDAIRTLEFDHLLNTRPDLMIVAAPSMHHASQTVRALDAGAAVLCEKPMALCIDDARYMAAAADRTGGLLAVAMVRRHFPASRAVRHVVRERMFGAVRAVDIFEGGAFRWPVRDQSYFSRAVSGGGVLADLGPHLLDLLYDWLGAGELVWAADDADGGVEANAALGLRYGEIPVSIRLSRDWQRPNRIALDLERATMVWRAETPGHVAVRTAEGEELEIGRSEPSDFLDCFGAQVDAVIDKLSGRPAEIVTVADALPVVALIEQAYATRRAMDMPWL